MGSPILHTEEYIDELEFVENTVIYGNDDAGISFNEYRSSEHDELIFENACEADLERSRDDCPDVADKVMTQGLHSAITMYISLAREVTNAIAKMHESGNLGASAA